MSEYSVDPQWKKIFSKIISDPTFKKANPYDAVPETAYTEKVFAFEFSLTPEESAAIISQLGGKGPFKAQDLFGGEASTGYVWDVEVNISSDGNSMWVKVKGGGGKEGQKGMTLQDAQEMAISLCESFGVEQAESKVKQKSSLRTAGICSDCGGTKFNVDDECTKCGTERSQKPQSYGSLWTMASEASTNVMLDYGMWTVDMEISYDYTPPQAGSGPSMDNAGGTPSFPGGIEFNKVVVHNATDDNGQKASPGVHADLGDEILEKLQAKQDPYDRVMVALMDEFNQ